MERVEVIYAGPTWQVRDRVGNKPGSPEPEQFVLPARRRDGAIRREDFGFRSKRGASSFL